MKVVYILNKFPVLSQTFVVDEIANHLRAGLDVEIVSLTARTSADFPAEQLDAAFAGRVSYLGLGWDSGPMIASLGGRLARRPSDVATVRRAFRGTAWHEWRIAVRASQIAMLLRRRLDEADIVHCHFGDTGQIVARALVAAQSRAALVTTIHAFEVTKKQSALANPVFRLFLDRSAAILCVNSIWRDLLLRSGAVAERTIVHHVGVDLDRLAEVPDAPRASDAPVSVVMTGRMVEKKGHLYALRAFAALRTREPGLRIRLDLVGSGALADAVEAEIARLGIGDIVTLHGSRPHAETLRLVCGADIFLLPSVTASDGDMEGIPVALMEALAFGLPVVSSVHSGIPELVEHGVSGLLCEERDVDGLADAIAMLARSRELRDRMGAAGRHRVAEAFAQQRLCAQLRGLYAALASGQPIEPRRERSVGA